MVATLLVVVFAVTLGWFPAAGAATLSSLVLPTAALMLGPTCVISRIVRRETAVVLDKDYIRTARGWRLGVLRTNARYVLPEPGDDHADPLRADPGRATGRRRRHRDGLRLARAWGRESSTRSCSATTR